MGACPAPDPPAGRPDRDELISAYEALIRESSLGGEGGAALRAVRNWRMEETGPQWRFAVEPPEEGAEMIIVETGSPLGGYYRCEALILEGGTVRLVLADSVDGTAGVLREPVSDEWRELLRGGLALFGEIRRRGGASNSDSDDGPVCVLTDRFEDVSGGTAIAGVGTGPSFHNLPAPLGRFSKWLGVFRTRIESRKKSMKPIGTNRNSGEKP